MYTYNLSVAMSGKSVEFDDKLLHAIQESVHRANDTLAASRQKRVITYEGLIDPTHIKLQMRSSSELNPTRSLSALSRLLVQYANENDPDLLVGKVFRSSIFYATIIDEEKNTTCTAKDMSNAELVKHIVELIEDPQYTDIADSTLLSLKKIVAKAIASGSGK